MVWLLWSSLAFATQPAVIGLGEARSVVLLLAPSLEERSVRCDDLDGDGVWTCPAGELPAELDALGLLVDGRELLQLAEVRLGEAPEAVVVERLGEALRVNTTPLPAREQRGEARRGAAALMVEVRGTGERAPRLTVQSARGSEDLACSDDGAFPDPIANDGVRTCAGLVEDGELTLTLRLPGESPRALGALSWPPELGLRQVRVDERGAAVASWPVLDRPGASAPRREDAPRPQGPGSGVGGPQPPPGGPAQVAPEQGPDALQLGLAGLGAAALFAAGWRLGRGRPAPIPHARALPPPPAVAGAPAGSAIFRASPGREGAALGWLAGRLAETRPVLVVDPRGAPLPQTGGGVVLLATSTDVDDVRAAAEAIARRALAPPAVLAPTGALSWPGGLGRTPEAVLLAALPAGAILALVAGEEAAPVALPEARLVEAEGGFRVDR